MTRKNNTLSGRTSKDFLIPKDVENNIIREWDDIGICNDFIFCKIMQDKEDHSIEMGDGTMKIVLNAVGSLEDVNPDLKSFLDYVAGKTTDDAYIQRLEAEVRRARLNKEWRREYMILTMRDLEKIEEGHEEGREIRDREKIAEMLLKGKTPEEISEFCDYPLALVQDVKESLQFSDI